MRRESTFAPSPTSHQRPTPEQTTYEMVKHFSLLGVIVVVYGMCLSQLDGDRRLVSAAWREITGELHPDAAKDAERLTEAEVVPKWQDFLHADDVTKQLNWFQTYCRDKFGMDDHVEFYWRCNIIEIWIDHDEKEEPLDPHMNCSRHFVRKHIEKGSDPRCVPHGERSLELLQRSREGKNKRKKKKKGKNDISLVPKVFDEYTVREGSPLFEPVEEELESILSRLDDLNESINNDLEGYYATHREATDSPTQSPSLRIANTSKGKRLMAALTNLEKKQMAHVLRKLRRTKKDWRKRNVTDAAKCPHLSCPWKRFQDVEENPDLPCYCFKELEKDDPKTMMLDEKIHINSVCRNHHWGLIHLCKPTTIKVAFHIDRLEHRSMQRHLYAHQEKTTGERLAWLRVEMNFKEVADAGGRNRDPSGWYATTLNTKEGQYYGFKSNFDGILGIVTLLLLFWVFFREFLWTLVCAPINLHGIWRVRRRAIQEWDSDEVRQQRQRHETRQHIAREEDEVDDKIESELTTKFRQEFEGKFRRLLDGRGCRLTYMSLLNTLLENLIALCLFMGFFMSGSDYYEQTVPADEGAWTQEPIPARVYIWKHCRGFNLVTEQLYEFFFDDLIFHCLAWGLMYLELLFYLAGCIKGLRWLPLTLTMAAVKMFYCLVAFASILIGFSVVFLIQFGQRFVQFSSTHRAFIEFFLLSMGFQGRIFEGIYPNQEWNSFLASIYIGFFLVFAVLIGLNFFITILLDAYSASLDPVSAHKTLTQTRRKAILLIMRSIGFPDFSILVDTTCPPSLSQSTDDPYASSDGRRNNVMPLGRKSLLHVPGDRSFVRSL